MQVGWLLQVSVAKPGSWASGIPVTCVLLGAVEKVLLSEGVEGDMA